MTSPRQLKTRKGSISFPAYIPVSTFGNRYPLDKLIQSYLRRLAPAVMVSYYYAKQRSSDRPLGLPLLVDSGGFAALFQGSRILEERGLGVLEINRKEETELLHPKDILEFQEQVADVAFSLDFPIPPGLDPAEAELRQQLTIANAIWAIRNRRRRDLPLYAGIQAWDADSARRCAQAYKDQPFEGIAIGGLVPRCHDMDLTLGIVKAVRAEIGDRPLHVFGIGNPTKVAALFAAGVDTVDSSSYVQAAASGQLLSNSDFKIDDPSPIDRLHLALINLAQSTGKSLPLSSAETLFSTFKGR